MAAPARSCARPRMRIRRRMHAGRRHSACAQPRLDVLEQRRAPRRGRDVDEQPRVALEGVLPDVGAVELAVHPASGCKRQDHAESDRHQPPGGRDRASHVQQDQQPDRCCGQHDGHPQAPQRRCRERARALRPAQERVELRPPDSRDQPAVCGEVLAPDERRCQIGHGAPGAPRHRRATRGCSSQSRRVSAPATVAAGPSHCSSDARPKRSRSSAYG